MSDFYNSNNGFHYNFVVGFINSTERKMKKHKFYLQYFAFFILFVSTASFAQNRGIEQFKWMFGEWKGESAKGSTLESWIKENENTMTGKGYYVVKGDTVVVEQLRIQKIGNYWTYIPIINNNKPVLFTLIKVENDIWVFENKEHDFPQRVIYSRKKDGSMLAWIEGEMKGKFIKEEYLMEKIKSQK